MQVHGINSMMKGKKEEYTENQFKKMQNTMNINIFKCNNF